MVNGKMKKSLVWLDFSKKKMLASVIRMRIKFSYSVKKKNPNGI